MLVRVRCKIGNFRYQVQESDDLQTLVAKVLEDAPEAEPATLAFSNQPRGGEQQVYGHTGPIKQYGISHGDLIFASWQDKTDSTAIPISQNGDIQAATPTLSPIDKDAWRSVQEDPVDVFLEQRDGKIPRKRDFKMCRHGDKAMCDYCMPLESYDEKHQQENKIKHLSFHSYLKKLDTAANKPTAANVSYLPPLEELDFKVAVPCSSGSHASWPAGICSKCQPSAITLSLQSYRMVDHVEYSNPAIIEQFIDFWRKQGGAQRFGYLIGRYEAYDLVPLGIKAVIEAIHEPPQAGDVDGIEVNMEWPDLAKIEHLAQTCGMKIVGMVYTDLLHDPDSKEGKVICKRHADSYFLSSVETIFSAKLQQARPNPSRFCLSGKFSSKFVTCVITGNEKGEIEVQAYQTSDQAMALVDADLIEASVNPGIVRVKKEEDPAQMPVSQNGSSSTAALTGLTKRYVPEVFYRYKNEYKIQVQESAKPCFPVDYLLVSLTHGFPTPEKANPMFSSNKFPIENRQGLQDQTRDLVLREIANISKGLSSSIESTVKGKGRASDSDSLRSIARWASDWHLLAFVQAELVGSIIDENDLRALIKVAISANKKEEEALQAVYELIQTSGWQTLLAFSSGVSGSAQSNAGSTAVDDDFQIPPELLDDIHMGNTGNAPTDSAVPGAKICPHCTFENAAGATDCDVCGLPIDS